MMGRAGDPKDRNPTFFGMVCEGPWHFYSVLFGFIRFLKMTHPPTLFALKMRHNASFLVN